MNVTEFLRLETLRDFLKYHGESCKPCVHFNEALMFCEAHNFSLFTTPPLHYHCKFYQKKEESNEIIS